MARRGEGEGESQAQKKKAKAPLAVALGYVMVAGATYYKVPQILRIHRAKSAAGVSLATSLLALLGQMFSLAYAVDQGFPLSAYGEYFPQFGSTVTILLQTLRYNHGASLGTLVSAACAAILAAVSAGKARLLLGAETGGAALHAMQSAVPLVTLTEKLPQVLQTWRAHSAGELSLTTSLLSLAGSLVRLYTSRRQLSHDVKAILPHAVGATVSSVVVAQIFAYKRR